MGVSCTSVVEGNIPNLVLICYQAVENELHRRRDWLFKKSDEMTKLRSNAILKAKDYLKNKELMLALTSAKAALLEDQKIEALTPIKEKLSKSISALAEERKKEESQPMTLERLKTQMSIKPVEKIKDLVNKWVSEFEDMLNTPVSSLSIIDELEKDIKSNPLELFKKLKDISDLGDFDERVIDIAFNPQMQALNIARKFIAEKNQSIDEEIRDYQANKEKCISQAKDNVRNKNYMNALMLIKTLPIFEAKIEGGKFVKKGLDNELKEIDGKLVNMKSTKPSLEEMKKIFSQDQAAVISDVIGEWLGKQQKIVSEMLTSPSDMLSTLSKPISMNPSDIVKELNDSKILPQIDVSSIIKGDGLKAVSNAASSVLGKFKFG